MIKRGEPSKLRLCLSSDNLIVDSEYEVKLYHTYTCEEYETIATLQSIDCCDPCGLFEFNLTCEIPEGEYQIKICLQGEEIYKHSCTKIT